MLSTLFQKYFYQLNNTPSIIRNTAASQGAGVSWVSLSETVFCMAAAFPPGVLF